MFDIEKEATRVHELNQKWWHDLDGNPIDRNMGQLFMLIISEIAEAMEGARKNIMDDHLPLRKMEEVEVADALIRTIDLIGGKKIPVVSASGTVSLKLDDPGAMLFALTKQVVLIEQAWVGAVDTDLTVAVADFLAMIFKYASYRDLDLLGAYEEKLAYNKTRADHQVEHRKLAGGKAW